MIITEINKSNYQDYRNLDIVAFSFAYAGAMGERGGIYIVDRDRQIYHANYVVGDCCIESEHIKDIIPIFEELSFGLLGCETMNENWTAIDLGFGNSLLIIKEFSEDFNREVIAGNYQGFGVLFQNWPGIVLRILGKEESHLTMNDIWEKVKF